MCFKKALWWWNTHRCDVMVASRYHHKFSNNIPIAFKYQRWPIEHYTLNWMTACRRFIYMNVCVDFRAVLSFTHWTNVNVRIMTYRSTMSVKLTRGHSKMIWLMLDTARPSKMWKPQPSITKKTLKIIYLKFHANRPGANELLQNIYFQNFAKCVFY